MAINKDSNAYTISFAIILVVLVGGLLAFVSTSLKPMQLSNVKNEKKQNILNSLPGINFESSMVKGSPISIELQNTDPSNNVPWKSAVIISESFGLVVLLWDDSKILYRMTE